MKITRELAIQILKYCFKNPDFYFPFTIVCKEYSPEDEDFVEICPNEWKNIEEDENYQTFELWENLQDLRENTTELLAKWFIDKILDNSKRKKFIFLTFEWYTYQPNSISSELDIENVQMIWISEWKTSKEAFENLKKENEWLFNTSFNEIYCHELLDNKYEYFYLP